MTKMPDGRLTTPTEPNTQGYVRWIPSLRFGRGPTARAEAVELGNGAVLRKRGRQWPGSGSTAGAHVPNGRPPAIDVPREGVSIVMPAYREEASLAATVEDFLAVPARFGIPHCVVVVDDGSTDRTGEIAEHLAAEHPGRVVALHHEVNRGYGPALATGIGAALVLGYRWLFLTDSDGQFKAEQLPAFLCVARRERADAVIGFRSRRADPWYRAVNAYFWTSASRLLLSIRARDIDCSYKLIDRRFLEGMTLKGRGATISPELIAKLQFRHARIVERPVNHFPRLHGEQTGAKPSVIVRSLASLLALSVEITALRVSRRWPTTVPLRITFRQPRTHADLTSQVG
jgi:Glycosyl transferase family 2